MGATSNKVGIQCANGMGFIKGEGEERKGMVGVGVGQGYLAGTGEGGKDECETKRWKKQSRCVCNYRDKQRQYEVVVAHID